MRPPGQEYHVDGFRFDLASIMTRAHSAWHPQRCGLGGGGGGARAGGPPPLQTTPQTTPPRTPQTRPTAAGHRQPPPTNPNQPQAPPTNPNRRITPRRQEAEGEPLALHSPPEDDPMGPILDANGVMSDGGGTSTGAPLSNPPLIEAISEDPVLRCGWARGRGALNP